METLNDLLWDVEESDNEANISPNAAFISISLIACSTSS